MVVLIKSEWLEKERAMQHVLIINRVIAEWFIDKDIS